MGALFDYFAASSDEQAATAIDRPAGPEMPDDRPGAPHPDPFDTVSVKGIDPVVQLGTLESLLTGRDYDEVVADPRSGEALAVRDRGERVVVTLTDALRDALANAGREQLAAVAVAWSRTEEFWGMGEPDAVTDFLIALAALAHRARHADQRLYCWVCV